MPDVADGLAVSAGGPEARPAAAVSDGGVEIEVESDGEVDEADSGSRKRAKPRTRPPRSGKPHRPDWDIEVGKPSPDDIPIDKRSSSGR